MSRGINLEGGRLADWGTGCRLADLGQCQRLADRGDYTDRFRGNRIRSRGVVELPPLFKLEVRTMIQHCLDGK